jgi:hypothetical protein
MLPGLERARMNHEEELIKAFFVPTKRETLSGDGSEPKEAEEIS